MFRKLLLVFLFFVSIRVYAVAETAVFDGYLNNTKPEKKALKILDQKAPSDTTRLETILTDSTLARTIKIDSMQRPIPFFNFEQKMSSYKGWLKSFQVF